MTSDSESRGPVLQIEVWNSYNGRRVQLRDETSIQTYDQLTQTIQDLTNIDRKAQVLLRSDGSTFLNSKRRRNDDTKLYLFSLSPYDVQEQVSEVIHPTSIEQQDFISLNLFERNSIAVRLHEAADKRVQYMLQIHMEIGQQQAAIDAVINNLRSHVQDYSDKFEILHSKFQSLEMNIREYLKEVDIEQLKNTPVIPQLKRFLGCSTLIELVSKKPENVDSFIHTLQDTLTASNQEFTTRSMAIDEIKIDYESIDIDNKTNKVDSDPSLLLEELFENEKRQKRLVEILTQNAPSDASAQTSILQELIQLDASSSDISQKMYEVKERTTQLVHKVLASIKVAQRKIVKKIHFVVMERIVVELERLLIKLQSVANFKTNFNLSVLELERRRQWKMTLLTTVRAIFQEEYTKRRSFQQLVGNYVGGSMTKMLEAMPVISEDDLTITLDRSAPTATIDTQAIIAELGERQFAEIGLDPSVYDHLNADISSSLDSSLESSILGSGSKLSTFTNQIEALIAQQASLETKAYQLEVKNEELLHKQELEVQQLKINFAQQIQEKLETITKLKETVDALRAETIKQKQIIDKGDEQLERITQMQLEFAKLRTISSRMATVEAENYKLKQNVDSLTSENNHLRKLQAQTAEKQSQYDLEQMYNTMAELNRDLTKQLDESKYKLKEEQERNKKQQKMVANLFAENEKKLQQEVDNLQATISLITSENTTTQQELRLLHNSLNSQQTAMYACIEKFQEMSSYLLLTHYYEELEKMKHTQEWDKLDLISQQIWNALATLLDKKNRS